MIRVGVIFGGKSTESDVSVISAAQAMSAFNESKYHIVPIYITKDNQWYTGPDLREIKNYANMELLLSKCTKINIRKEMSYITLMSDSKRSREIDKVDIIFPITHGTNVEDGALQGMLKLLEIPYVGCDVGAAAVGQDKVFMKNILRDSKIKTTDFMWYFADEYIASPKQIIEEITQQLSLPLIVKPANLGSSVGISIAKTKKELSEAIEYAIEFDIKFLVEKVVENLIEVNCSVLGDNTSAQTSVIEEVLGEDEFLSFEDKYVRGSSGGSKGTKGEASEQGMASVNRRIPADISKTAASEVERLALATFRALNTSGVSRIDFLIDSKTNEVFVNEINTIPGSLSYYLWEPKGIPYEELLDELVKIGIKNYQVRMANIFVHNSNLFDLHAKGGTKGQNKGDE